MRTKGVGDTETTIIWIRIGTKEYPLRFSIVERTDNMVLSFRALIIFRLIPINLGVNPTDILFLRTTEEVDKKNNMGCERQELRQTPQTVQTRKSGAKQKDRGPTKNQDRNPKQRRVTSKQAGKSEKHTGHEDQEENIPNN